MNKYILLDYNDLSEKNIINIRYVQDLATLSKCRHGKVACVLFAQDFSQIYSIGINGGPSGQKDCVCNELDAKYGCAHAEQNCLIKNSDFDKPKIMICTRACCPTCATLIVNSNANIKEFWYLEDFKDVSGLQILEDANIDIFKVKI